MRTLRLPEAPQASSPFWWLWERFTDVHTATYKATKGKIGGTYGKAPVALVDSVGRKSGKRRTHPLLATKDGGNVVVVASKGGVHKHPAWYHNLMANPETTVKLVRRRPEDAREGDRGGGARAPLEADDRGLPDLRGLPAPDGSADPGDPARAGLSE